MILTPVAFTLFFESADLNKRFSESPLELKKFPERKISPSQNES